MEDDKPEVLICMWCHRRITTEELRSGRHDHVDIQERIDSDQAANNGVD
jgi:hypothetical protein